MRLLIQSCHFRRCRSLVFGALTTFVMAPLACAQQAATVDTSGRELVFPVIMRALEKELTSVFEFADGSIVRIEATHTMRSGDQFGVFAFTRIEVDGTSHDADSEIVKTWNAAFPVMLSADPADLSCGSDREPSCVSYTFHVWGSTSDKSFTDDDIACKLTFERDGSSAEASCFELE